MRTTASLALRRILLSVYSAHENPRHRPYLTFHALAHSSSPPTDEAALGALALTRTVLANVHRALSYPTRESMVEIFRAFAQVDKNGDGWWEARWVG